MWEKWVENVLHAAAAHGRITVTFPSGRRVGFGPGPDLGLEIELRGTRTLRQLLLAPDMALGEAYMDGRLVISNDDLDGFVRFLSANADHAEALGWRRATRGLRRIKGWLDQINPAARARANVAHHYDLSSRLYDLFLDEDRQYSCAYFSQPGMSLEAAQAAKKGHIAGKLLLQPDMEVLDIGCGWGGLGLSLARDYGVRVLGVTLSEEQHRIACARAEAAGLEDRVRFELRDYRDVTESFDRVVSVGMFEHVGLPHYRAFFDAVHARLRENGVALIHTIGRAGPPGATAAWITKYIFPGGYAPSMSQMASAIETSGLVTTDAEIWRLHYAETLRHWYDRFSASEEEARALYDTRFCRMWRYYLKVSEHTFRYRNQVVFQMQMARQQDAVPLTRDYLYAPAAQMAAAE